MSNYYIDRIINELDITEELNTIELLNEKGVKYETKIFTEDKNGNIDILFYDLDRKTIKYDHPNAKPDRPNINNDREQTYKIKRIAPENITTSKYIYPKTKPVPFIPPYVLKLYEQKKEIKNLVLTEGAFKAFKGSMYNIPVIGLGSIQHYKDKKGNFFPDIIKIIKTCKVQNIIMLYDADIIELKEEHIKNEKDLRLRTFNFYSSATNIRDLLKDIDIEIWVFYVKNQDIKEKPKGLDDLLVVKKGHENHIRAELDKFTKHSYFHPINITDTPGKLFTHLRLNSAKNFYSFHSKHIQSREFIFNGTKYKYNQSEDEVEIIMPGEAKLYFRVANDYFKKINKPNKNGVLEEVIQQRMKTTIVDDHGRKFLNFVNKYEDFVNIPDHVSYERIIHNCYNSYYPFTHEPEEGSIKNTEIFLKHIFGTYYQLALDYVQLLYQKPTQILPVLCLVSEENSTGKTSFGYWLQRIFTQNVTLIGNAEISNDFNAHLASKLVIAIDEGFIEKKAIVEKIKKLATAETMPMTRKGKDTVEIDFYGKIIIMSNNVDNFISANDEDVRYWVIEVPKLKKQDQNMMKRVYEEIPAFLYFLNKRKMHSENKTRAWFDYELIKTEALKRVIDASKPQGVRELRHQIREMFFEFGDQEILLTSGDIKRMFFDKNSRYNEDTIRYYIKKYFKKVKTALNKQGLDGPVYYKIPYMVDNGFETHEKKYKAQRGRPFVFKIEDFLNLEEMTTAGDVEQYESEEDIPDVEPKDMPF